MSILHLIKNGVLPMAMQSGGLGGGIVATPEQEVEQTRLEAMFPNAPKTAPAPSPNVQQPAEQPRKGGVLNALKSIFLPEADSFMYAALNNPNGLWGARGAQQTYRQGLEEQRLANEKAALEIEKARRSGQYQIAGNNLIFFPPDGTIPQIITPPTTPSEQERLFAKWSVMPEGPEKEMLALMLRGAQYSEPVINRQTRSKLTVQGAGISQRGEQARRTKQTPGASAGSGKSTTAKLPAGFILNP